MRRFSTITAMMFAVAFLGAVFALVRIGEIWCLQVLQVVTTLAIPTAFLIGRGQSEPRRSFTFGFAAFSAIAWLAFTPWNWSLDDAPIAVRPNPGIPGGDQLYELAERIVGPQLFPPPGGPARTMNYTEWSNRQQSTLGLLAHGSIWLLGIVGGIVGVIFRPRPKAEPVGEHP
jgi:hypothetical protein